MQRSLSLETFLEGVTSVTVPLWGDLTVSYESSVLLGLRQLMAHLGEGQLSQQEMLERLAMPKYTETYLALRGLGMIQGPDANELDTYHDAVHNANQVKMPPKIELTALGTRLNLAGKQLYKQASMSAGDYDRSLDEPIHETE